MKTKKEITLYSKAGGSDKVYTLTLKEVSGGYVVHYMHGRREVGPFQSGTKTPDPADKRKDKPVTLAEAEKIFAAVEREKRTGKSKYHEDLNETAPSPATQIEANSSSPLRVECMELTAVMDATEAVKLLRNPAYGVQEKHDGIRLLLHASPSGVTAYNRSGDARTFPSVVSTEALALAKLVGSLLIDGELVGERYHAFDIIQLKGADLRGKTWEQRMSILESVFEVAAGTLKSISFVPWPTEEDDKIALLQDLHSKTREGIVIKRRTSTYTAGRSKEWFKFKFVATASVIVLKHNERRSVTMALLHDGKLKEVGHLPIPTNKQMPPVDSIVEVRYRKADPKSLNLIEAVFLNVREDVKREDCNTKSQQLKFTTKAA